MSTEMGDSLGWVAIVVIWVLACIVGALSIYRRRRTGEFYPEHGFLIGAILMLALAPSVLLITHLVDRSASLSQIVIHLIFGVFLLLAFARARHRRRNPEDSGPSLTFHEKSSLLIVLGHLIVFGSYFYNICLFDKADLDCTGGTCPDAAIPAFFGALVMLVIIMIIGHILIALTHSPIGELNEPPDERDRQIWSLGSRNAGWVTGLGFWAVPVMALAPLSMYHVLNIWLAIAVMSSVTRYGSIAAYYRFGVR
ncbi:MAG: hypothetical protein O2780_01020 [Proteobacteria bacterium]|jgi:hypothetical protein|nr:hypothetical protein [Pseudomonadota bacterium]MDA1300401.1 hypothetical protein [Pseudomonadota bacterium]